MASTASIVIASLAALISAGALAFGYFTWRLRVAEDQRDLMLHLHERLIDRDLQQGRRIVAERVNSPADATALLRENREDYDLANRALAMLDFAALYAEKGYVDKDEFVGEWGRAYAHLRQNGQHFIEERAARIGESSESEWRHFQALAQETAGRSGSKGSATLPDAAGSAELSQPEVQE